MNMTYIKCPCCKGDGIIVADRSDRQDAKCPCTRTTEPGWMPTGVTESQIDRIKATIQACQELANDPKFGLGDSPDETYRRTKESLFAVPRFQDPN